jgi:hypothetical protein
MKCAASRSVGNYALDALARYQIVSGPEPADGGDGGWFDTAAWSWICYGRR